MKPKQRQKILPLNFTSRINHYLLSTLLVAVTALLCAPLSNAESYHVVSFILLFLVSIMATFMGIGPILLAATLSSLVWNYFFIPPHFTFQIDKTEDILMFGMFFIIALLNGILTARVRKQEQLAREREERTNALFQLTRGMSKASSIQDIKEVAVREIKTHFLIDPIFILQDGNNVLTSSQCEEHPELDTDKEFEIAQWVFRNGCSAGKGTQYLNQTEYTYHILPGVQLTPGVVAIKARKSFSEKQTAFWETFLVLIANALEREFLGNLAKKASLLDESDRLYKTLFNSISHELRIPVATIMGASDTLMLGNHSGKVCRALVGEIFTASFRLNRIIENLLNMSRLESGRLAVRLDWCDINDLINKVTEDLKEELKPFSFHVTIPETMPLVKIDFGLMEQVLYNLVFNACEHAPAASDIDLITSFAHHNLTIIIRDKGPGFPEEALNNVFRKFFKVNDRKTGGLGLGLSIVKGFVEAHQGTVSVGNGKNGGAEFTITIPVGSHQIENLLT